MKSKEEKENKERSLLDVEKNREIYWGKWAHAWGFTPSGKIKKTTGWTSHGIPFHSFSFFITHSFFNLLSFSRSFSPYVFLFHSSILLRFLIFFFLLKYLCSTICRRTHPFFWPTISIFFKFIIIIFFLCTSCCSLPQILSKFSIAHSLQNNGVLKPDNLHIFSRDKSPE